MKVPQPRSEGFPWPERALIDRAEFIAAKGNLHTVAFQRFGSNEWIVVEVRAVPAKKGGYYAFMPKEY